VTTQAVLATGHTQRDRDVRIHAGAALPNAAVESAEGHPLPLLQQASAATILLTLPVIAIAFVAQKYLVAGLNSGAVKG
jgi:ABC-type glycerol-3-phosphate transport system permease component